MNPSRQAFYTDEQSSSVSVRQSSPPLGRAGSKTKTIRVLLAEDHPVVRMGISSFLRQHPKLELLAEAKDGLEALKKAKELLPNIVVADIDMPGLDGFGLSEILRRELPQIKVILLSGLLETRLTKRILQSGARGFLSKEASPEEFLTALELVASGRNFFSPNIARAALNQFVANVGLSRESSRLSEREQEVVILVAEGLSNKEIAIRLDIGTRTVETHREHAMRKLDIHSVAELTMYAVANGFVQLPETGCRVSQTVEHSGREPLTPTRHRPE